MIRPHTRRLAVLLAATVPLLAGCGAGGSAGPAASGARTAGGAGPTAARAPNHASMQVTPTHGGITTQIHVVVSGLAPQLAGNVALCAVAAAGAAMGNQSCDVAGGMAEQSDAGGAVTADYTVESVPSAADHYGVCFLDTGGDPDVCAPFDPDG